MLFATAFLDENARDEQLEAMQQMMIESRSIADAAEQDYLEYKEALASLRELEERAAHFMGTKLKAILSSVAFGAWD